MEAIKQSSKRGTWREPSKPYTWTYALTRESVSRIRESVRMAGLEYRATKSLRRLRQEAFALRNRPGFSAVRQQVKALAQHLARQVPKGQRAPQQLEKLGLLVQPRDLEKWIKCASYPVTVSLARYRNGEPSWFPETGHTRLRGDLWLFAKAAKKK